jgi:hypothetical protein
VPIAPLAVRTRFVRPGKKVQLVEASLLEGDTEVARCTALRMRRAAVALPPDLPTVAVPPGPDSGSAGMPPWSEQVTYAGFHNAGVEHRFDAGSFLEAGPATDCVRLRVPLVAGDDTSPVAPSPRRRTSTTESAGSSAATTATPSSTRT